MHEQNLPSSTRTPGKQEPGCDSCLPTRQEPPFKERFSYGPSVSTELISKPSFVSADLSLERSPAALQGLHRHPQCQLCSPFCHPLSKPAAALLAWTLCPAFRENLLHREHESPISLNSTEI